MKRDPVCGMHIEPRTAAAKLEYEGATYYFCSERCQAAFHADPKRFLGGRGGG